MDVVVSGLDGFFMGLDPRVTTQDDAIVQPSADAVLDLCEQCRTLNERRINLDQGLSALAADAQERDLLWETLEATLTALPPLMAQLAATRASGHDQLRSKAATLALLLQVPEDDAIAFGTELRNLALSVANDVVRLI